MREVVVATPAPLPLEVFCIVIFLFFVDYKTSAPEVLSSCLFISRAHFETSLVMVSFYGYEI